MPRIPRPSAASAEIEFAEEADEFDEAPDPANLRSGSSRSQQRRLERTEEDQPPSSRASRRAARDEEDEDDDTDSPIGAGWDAFKKKRAESGDYAENLKIEADAVLIAFLDNEPFAVYREHWIERPGKKSFICIEKDCPLCDAGDNKPRVKTVFNVVELQEDNEPKVVIWTTAPRLTGQLASLDADEKVGPLTKGYWSVKRTGKGTKTTYNISPVKERDLQEDWGVAPLSDDDFAVLESEAYDTSAISFSTKQQLREVARELTED